MCQTDPGGAREMKKVQIRFCLILALSAFSSIVFGQESRVSEFDRPFLMSISPGVLIPIGVEQAIIRSGGIAALSAEFLPARPAWLGITIDTGYSLNPYAVDSTISTITIGGGFCLRFAPSHRFTLRLGANAGYAVSLYDIVDQQPTSTSFITGSAEARYIISPGFGLGVAVGYRHLYLMYGSAFASFGGKLYMGTRSAVEESPIIVDSPQVATTASSDKVLSANDLKFDHVFPVFYSYYRNNPVGTVVIANTGAVKATDVKVSFLVNQYMELAKECAFIPSVDPGAEEIVELTALFTNEVLKIIEGETVAAEILLEYTVDGERHYESYAESMHLEFRNAMSWDDTNKAAAFVTVRDPWVQTFAKNIAGAIKQSEYKISPNLARAIAYYETMRLYGITYSIDANSSYAEKSGDMNQIDSLQFPQETLKYAGGDCDDLSILSCALLESVGIRTAFITVPGHIYPAFATGMTPEEGRRAFLQADDLIFYDNETWIPVEITALDSDFLEAWRIGSKEWRESNSQNQAGFYPIYQAWELYKPVGLPEAPALLSLPETNLIYERYNELVESYIDDRIYPTVATLRERIRESDRDPRIVNKLGVLYARHGLYDKALAEFEVINAVSDDVPILLNTGMIHLLRKDLEQAQTYYQRALNVSPDDPEVLLSVARINHEAENYGLAREAFEKLKVADSELAEEYAYIELRGEEATRAADAAGISGRTRWVE